MVLAVTGTLEAGEKAPLVFRGSYEEIISGASKAGYQAVELHIHDSSRLDREGLKALFQKYAMTLSSIGTGSAYARDGISLAHQEPDKREQAVERMKEHILTAADYGAVVIIGLIKGMVSDLPDEEAYHRNLEGSMKTLVAFAEAHKVTLVFEILNRYESETLNTIEEGLEYIAKFHSDYLKLHIDTYHMNIEEGDIAGNIRKAKGKIGHCHIADSDRWYAGHGHYDFQATIEALRDIGYEGALSVESFYYPTSEESAKRSMETLKQFV